MNQADLPANAGSTITFQTGLNGPISLQAALPQISQNVKIIGPGTKVIGIQGNGNAANPYRIFTVNPNVTAEIDNLMIFGGFDNSTDGGGGILNQGNLTLINDTIADSTATQYGGGINNELGASLNLTNDDIEFNKAPDGGGIANFGELISCCGSSTAIIANNATNGDGGGIYNLGTVQLQDGVQISGNTATNFGGGVYNAGLSDFTMDGGLLANNDADWGGGLFTWGTTTLDSGLIVQQNQANEGAGMFLGNISTDTLNTVTIQNNILVGNNPVAKGIYLQNGAVYNPTNVMDADDPGGQPVKGI